MNQTINITRRKDNTILRSSKLKNFIKKCKKQKYLILMSLPAFLIILIFSYFPMYGILMAFQNFNVAKGVSGSPWVGLKWFKLFFDNPLGFRLLKNTFLLGIYSLLWGFPAPIILALLMNEIYHEKFKKIVQTISYLPHFISTVVIVGMLKQMGSYDGLFNQITGVFGMEPISFFLKPEWFRTLFIGSGIWQGVGWGTIIYLAAISSIDPQLYEAAILDGANRWHNIKYVTLPSIFPTITILFILSIGGILGADFMKVILMYNTKIYEVADIIGTYVYREGIQGARFSYTTAVGLFMSIISFILIYSANFLSKKFSETSLW